MVTIKDVIDMNEEAFDRAKEAITKSLRQEFGEEVSFEILNLIYSGATKDYPPSLDVRIYLRKKNL